MSHVKTSYAYCLHTLKTCPWTFSMDMSVCGPSYLAPKLVGFCPLCVYCTTVKPFSLENGKTWVMYSMRTILYPSRHAITPAYKLLNLGKRQILTVWINWKKILIKKKRSGVPCLAGQHPGAP